MRCTCGAEVPALRANLGYTTCLTCGERAARLETKRRTRRLAPAYNKGPVMYITDKTRLEELGRK